MQPTSEGIIATVLLHNPLVFRTCHEQFPQARVVKDTQHRIFASSGPIIKTFCFKSFIAIYFTLNDIDNNLLFWFPKLRKMKRY